MKNKLFRKYLPIVCLLATGVYANQLLAGWADGPQSTYSKRFGDFPPLDIDEQLQQGMTKDMRSEDSQPQSRSQAQPASRSQSQARFQSNSATSIRYQKDSYPAQEKTSQKYQQANDSTVGLISGPAANVTPAAINMPKKRSGKKKKKKKHKSGFSFPWSNNGSGFSAPWNNRRSSFSAPWNNKGSGFSAPWNNNNSSFTTPWDNKGSGFSAPWDNNNNGSGFTWGKRHNR